jgi:hypothetical protein
MKKFQRFSIHLWSLYKNRKKLIFNILDENSNLKQNVKHPPK